MSDCRKFVVDEDEKSTEDRLTELERKLPIFIERMQSYEVIINDSKILKNSLESISLTHKRSESSIKDAMNMLNSMRSQIDDKFRMQFESNTTTDRCLGKLQSDVMEFRNSINVLRENQSSVKKECEYNFKISNESFSTKEEIGNLIECIDKSVCSLKDRFRGIESTYLIVEEKQKNLSDYSHQLNSEIKNLRDMYESMNMKIIDSESKIKNVPNTISDMLRNLMDGFHDVFEKKINEIKEEFKQHPRTAEDIKKHIMHDLECVSMDSKNAILKVSNSSQQIAILEKKIENLYLLIKKYELNK